MLEGRDPPLTLRLEGTQDPPWRPPAVEQGTTPRPLSQGCQIQWIFVMSGSGWHVHASSLDIQDRCSACWFPPSSGGPTFWNLESPDELSCSWPPGIARVPVHIRTESFNRFTPAFKTAGDTSSTPALVVLITKDSLWNWVSLSQIYLPFHYQRYLNTPNRSRTSFPRSTQI